MTKDSIESINALLDGQMTDAEFNEEIERSRFLRECKTKGFEECKRLGLIAPAEKKHLPRGPAPLKRKIEMTEKVKKINEMRWQGIQAKEAAFAVGISYQQYHDWAFKLDMMYNGPHAKRHGIKKGAKKK
jgi:hypothetical protein